MLGSIELRHDKSQHSRSKDPSLTLIDQVEQGDVVVVCRHNQPVAELRAIERPLVQPARVAGLLKGRVNWEPEAFAPMTGEELADFGGTPIFPPVDPA